MNCAQIGEPGTGKSRSLRTILPFIKRQQKPFVIVDLDGKFTDDPVAAKAVKDGLFIHMDPGFRTSTGSFLDRIKKIDAVPAKPPEGWMKIGDIMDDLDQNADKFCGACIDTLTMLEDHIKAFISFTNRRGKFEYDDWTSLQLSYKELFRFFYALKMPLKIINMHSQLEKEEATGRLKLMPKIQGGFRDIAGSYPTEFLLSFADPNPDKTKGPIYSWQIAPDARFTSRSNIFEGKLKIPQDWEPICKTLG
jgi:hypothetical protein